MDILVCFKTGPDLDMLNAADWLVNDALQVNTDFVPVMLNPYDESALELGLRLRDGSCGTPADVQLTALTIGPDDSRKALKNLLALQYDHALRVHCALDIRFNAPAVAAIIHRYMQKENHQVLLCGSQSNEGANGKTPLLVAEKLGIPCITAVSSVMLSKQPGCLEVISRFEGCQLVQTVKPPVVLAVGNAPGTYIRVPTLKDRLNSARKEVKVYSLAELGLSEQGLAAANDLEVIDLFPETHERSGVAIQGRCAAEKAAVVYEEYLRKRFKL